MMKTAAMAICMTLLLAACQSTSPYLWEDTEFSDSRIAWTWTKDRGPAAETQAQALADTHCKKYGRKAANEPFETMGFTAAERTLEHLEARTTAMFKYFSHQPNIKSRTYMIQHWYGSPAGRQVAGGLDRLYLCRE
jgi:hypothetical protein